MELLFFGNVEKSCFSAEYLKYFLSWFVYKQNNQLSLLRERRCKKMIVVNVKENESIEKALKRFKKKFDRTGTIRELRARQYFEKPSITKRNQRIKAAYKQRLQDEEGK